MANKSMKLLFFYSGGQVGFRRSGFNTDPDPQYWFIVAIVTFIYLFKGTRDNSDSSNYTGAGTDGDEAHDLKRKEFYEVQYS
jgi:hypothetical protein